METTPLFYEVYGFYTKPWWQVPWKVGCLILIIIGIAISAYVFYRVLPRSAKSPWERALNDLEKLTPLDYATQKDFSLYYASLTKIMKNYVQEIFGWEVSHATDDELITLLIKNNAPAIIQETAEKIRNAAIGVKFARMDALKEEARRDKEVLIELIKQSIPATQRK